MDDFTAGRTRKTGLSPGSLVYVGDEGQGAAHISVLQYGVQGVEERTVTQVREVFPWVDRPGVTWISLEGLHDVGPVAELGNHFGIHPLVLEDIISTGQRPKVEDHEGYLFVVLQMLVFDEEDMEIEDEQLALLFGHNFLISLQEKRGDLFNTVKERVRSGRGRIRGLGPDYLAYALMDTVVDHYFVILEKLGNRINALEDQLTESQNANLMQQIYRLRNEIVSLRRSVWPLREVISGLQREDSPLLQDSTRIYLRDVYDHTVQVIETVETMRDMASGLLDLYLSTVSHRMNEVMQVLTMIATIFIPLTFIAGVYGMNFRYMPELDWSAGYFMALLLMGLTAVGMLLYFKKKKWF